MGPGGWDYVENAKNILLCSVGFIVILLLNFVTITSKDLQEILTHTLITGFISDQIQKYIDRVNKPKRLYYGMGPVDPPNVHSLGPHSSMSGVPRRPSRCHTDNRVIMNLKPTRAAVIPHHKIKDYMIIEMDLPLPNTKPTRLLSIIDDYDRN